MIHRLMDENVMFALITKLVMSSCDFFKSDRILYVKAQLCVKQTIYKHMELFSSTNETKFIKLLKCVEIKDNLFLKGYPLEAKTAPKN